MNRRGKRKRLVCASLFSVLLIASSAWSADWTKHVIDDSASGADGVRLLDVNRDGRLDLATGWEEAGLVRVYIQPEDGRQRWPQATVGTVGSPEDAVFCDLDGDGNIDVVSCCEGSVQSVFVHWSPTSTRELLNEANWKTEVIPQLAGQQSWMFAAPGQIDGQNGPDLVVGSKGKKGSITLLQSPPTPRKLSDWPLVELRKAGWIMSLQLHDMNDDGQLDILLSDRRGKRRGVYWLENPADSSGRGPWREHEVGGRDREVMFVTRADMDADGRAEILATTQDGHVLKFAPSDSGWNAEVIPIPSAFRRGKGIAVGDLNHDQQADIAVTSEDGFVGWLENSRDGWRAHQINGSEGIKFDRIELLDLDGDGDLDLMTCEERAGLGIIWYENPISKASFQSHAD